MITHFSNDRLWLLL